MTRGSQDSAATMRFSPFIYLPMHVRSYVRIQGVILGPSPCRSHQLLAAARHRDDFWLELDPAFRRSKKPRP